MKRYSFWLFMIAALCLFCGGAIILIFKLLRRTSIPLENIYEKSILSSPWSKYDELVDDNVLSANEVEQHGEVLRTCSIRSCVDFSRCAGDFKIHVYPSDVSDSQTNGRVYDKIIETIRNSRYHTTKASEACLFIVAHDTTDRDVRSTNYVHRLQDKLKMSELWRNGQNHVVFNSYSGTFPDYAETYRFNLGNAMLAKASISAASYRPGFDISFPLFLNNHPFKDNALNASLTTKMYPSGHKYKLAFKGKRYLYGVGSEVRNKVFLLHNRKEIVLLTTCKHGNQWQKLADAKCEDDNKEYDRYSYSDLLENSTFCLVPRGRRLGSFRFLEALKVGCIPVVLSDDWILPFQEVIDWSKCSLVVSEHNLLQIPSILTMLSDSTITSMRQQALFIYESYFSSLEKIVSVTLEILKERIIPSYRRHHYMWNHPPGALAVFPEFSRSLKDFPFYYPLVGISPKPRFTAVIYAVSAVPYASSPLFQLIRVINESKFVDQILIIWLSTSRIPRKDLWPKAKVLMSVVYASRKSANSRFFHSHLVKTDAIFALDENAVITSEEMDFTFSVWMSFPDRLVGPDGRTHFWDDSKGGWSYSSKVVNSYSLMLASSVVYHRYYNYLYTHKLPQSVEALVHELQDCESLAMNFLVASITYSPPILTTSARHKRTSYNPHRIGRANVEAYDHFKNYQLCFPRFVEEFAMVLPKSVVKFNPSLYRDPVSSVRKKFKYLENS